MVMEKIRGVFVSVLLALMAFASHFTRGREKLCDIPDREHFEKFQRVIFFNDFNRAS